MICEVSFLYSIAYFMHNLNSENAKICANYCLILYPMTAFHNGDGDLRTYLAINRGLMLLW